MDQRSYSGIGCFSDLFVNFLTLFVAGVSNYGVHHLKELLGSNPTIRPVVNQIEVRSLCSRV